MYYVGMMSGTSLDGIDAVLARCDAPDGRWVVVTHAATAIPTALRKTLYQLNFPGKIDSELHAAKTAEQQLTRCYADTYQRLIDGVSDDVAAEIVAVAAHGQTIRHEPNATLPYTVQLLNGALLAQLTQQTVVCDFRSRDIAAGGQGAPLAPLFHRQLFGSLTAEAPTFAVVNIGGISNISVIVGGEHFDYTKKRDCNSDCNSDCGLDYGLDYGFDCGPGNCLLDEWIAEHCSRPYDKDANWAKQGRVLSKLLTQLLRDPYFAAPAPKSTGRDRFNRAWLTRGLAGDEVPVDVMRTLVRLTATTIADAVLRAQTAGSPISRLIVTGGGAKNPLLVADLQYLLSPEVVAAAVSVCDAPIVGIDAQHVEALGFAWLGKATLERRPLSTQAITGASTPVILGAIYI